MTWFMSTHADIPNNFTTLMIASYRVYLNRTGPAGKPRRPCNELIARLKSRHDFGLLNIILA